MFQGSTSATNELYPSICGKQEDFPLTKQLSKQFNRRASRLESNSEHITKKTFKKMDSPDAAKTMFCVSEFSTGFINGLNRIIENENITEGF